MQMHQQILTKSKITLLLHQSEIDAIVQEMNDLQIQINNQVTVIASLKNLITFYEKTLTHSQAYEICEPEAIVLANRICVRRRNENFADYQDFNDFIDAEKYDIFYKHAE